MNGEQQAVRFYRMDDKRGAQEAESGLHFVVFVFLVLFSPTTTAAAARSKRKNCETSPVGAYLRDTNPMDAVASVRRIIYCENTALARVPAREYES